MRTTALSHTGNDQKAQYCWHEEKLRARPSSKRWAALLPLKLRRYSWNIYHLCCLMTGEGCHSNTKSTTDLKIPWKWERSVTQVLLPPSLTLWATEGQQSSPLSPTAHLIGWCASEPSPFAPDCTFPPSDPAPPSERRSQSTRDPEYWS